MDFIEVTYRMESEKPVDIRQKAESIAKGQTTDTWTPTTHGGLRQLKKHQGIVLHVQDKGHALAGAAPTLKPRYVYHLTIGFPPQNTEKDIPSLLTMIFGKISMDGKIRVESIDVPPTYLRNKGPAFGIPGLRKILRQPKNPLTMAIFKPCVGLSPKELADLFYELAMGGMNLVKDDEILPDLPICPTEKRLEMCLKAADRAEKETKHRTLYAINLTGTPSQLIQKAKRLARHGAECFLLNVLSYGYGVLEEVKGVGVPIMVHPALAGALCGSQDTGFSYGVILGTLMRVAGADIVLFPSSYGTVTLSPSDTDTIREALTRRQIRLKPSFPVPSAGIHPGLVPRILKDYGMDVIINAGGGVHGHPDGPRAGARAFQQAIHCASQKRELASITANESPELFKALMQWGRE